MDIAAGIVLTGSQDHTLKVFRLETSSLQYTLHGHCGPITSLFIDRWQNGTAGSGSQDGSLCIWDLITGIYFIYFCSYFYLNMFGYIFQVHVSIN